MEKTPSERFRPSELTLLQLEHLPFSAFWRAGVGSIVSVLFMHRSRSQSLGSFTLYLVGLLVALRVVPVAFRKVIPFSSELKAAWAARRALGKQYDSYQWRKLFWIGTGLLASAAFVSGRRGPPMWVGLVCMASGGLGALLWRRRRKMDSCVKARLASYRGIV